MKKIFVLTILVIIFKSVPTFAFGHNNTSSKNINSNIQIYFVNPINKKMPSNSGEGE